MMHRTARVSQDGPLSIRTGSQGLWQSRLVAVPLNPGAGPISRSRSRRSVFHNPMVELVRPTPLPAVQLGHSGTRSRRLPPAATRARRNAAGTAGHLVGRLRTGDGCGRIASLHSVDRMRQEAGIQVRSEGSRQRQVWQSEPRLSPARRRQAPVVASTHPPATIPALLTHPRHLGPRLPRGASRKPRVAGPRRRAARRAAGRLPDKPPACPAPQPDAPSSPSPALPVRPQDTPAPDLRAPRIVGATPAAARTESARGPAPPARDAVERPVPRRFSSLPRAQKGEGMLSAALRKGAHGPAAAPSPVCTATGPPPPHPAECPHGAGDGACYSCLFMLPSPSPSSEGSSGSLATLAEGMTSLCLSDATAVPPGAKRKVEFCRWVVVGWTHGRGDYDRGGGLRAWGAEAPDLASPARTSDRGPPPPAGKERTFEERDRSRWRGAPPALDLGRTFGGVRGWPDSAREAAAALAALEGR
ncbi:hypothetical protein DFJ74DRAFT_646958 [Hyaloraphidium curvatum]|nr:hypothetical protein DFJ74DRAFT_646958 [Hyaloraphidium curvatum]